MTKYWLSLMLVCGAAPCAAQTNCTAVDAVRTVREEQEEMQRVKVGETSVPPAARQGIQRLKDALTCLTDARLAGQGPALDAGHVSESLAVAVGPDQPGSVKKRQEPKEDPGFDEFAQTLEVRASHPAGFPKVLQVMWSISIPCGEDGLLLVYTLDEGVWRKRLRWQAPPLKELNEAFGDFFETAFLTDPPGDTSRFRIAVAHGSPWCTSRFSSFDIDVISPGANADSATVEWHTGRGYSRGDFGATLKGSANVFELRLNAPTFDADVYEHRVVYRYQVGASGVRRLGPLAIHARGFVEEWLEAPWEELAEVTASENAPALREIYDAYNAKSPSEKFSYSHGAVRACAASGTFQVQFDAELNGNVPGKPRGETRPLPGLYFRVREGKDGYVMVSAGNTPDPTCKGGNLMPK